MECNRDEAVRAKEISEKKFEEEDYLGAKKFVLKAQSLYPGLNGLQPMLAALEVYISAETKIDGESDWYKVLGVNPNADDETIRKQYRKSALALHPDKNKFVGADGAFKLIAEAWNTLSDKIKKALFDQKRHIRVVKPQNPQNVPDDVGSSKSATIPKTVPQKAKPAARKRKSQDGTSTTTAQRNDPITLTFWTVCHRCKLQHEYPRMYINRNLLCPICQFPYYSYEYPPPTSQTPKMPTSQFKFPF